MEQFPNTMTNKPNSDVELVNDPLEGKKEMDPEVELSMLSDGDLMARLKQYQEEYDKSKADEDTAVYHLRSMAVTELLNRGRASRRQDLEQALSEKLPEQEFIEYANSDEKGKKDKLAKYIAADVLDLDGS